MEISTELIISLLLGIGLSAAVGFRIFVPLLISALGAYFFDFNLNENFSWIGTLPAVVIFGTATLFEIVAYFIPWFDNLLDTIATPAAFFRWYCCNGRFNDRNRSIVDVGYRNNCRRRYRYVNKR